MLKEISCDKFKHGKVTFYEGLNTVLGDDIGSNSIGKTTLLMIIDFAFGGDDLMKATEIFSNIGHLEVKYKFSFSDQSFYFVRKTETPNTIFKCNENFETIEELNKKQYTDFLFSKYHIGLKYISFREVVGLFSRIYGKENDNENKPLNIVRKESDDTAIQRLMKLFDLYSKIAELAKQKEINTERYNAFKKAQKYSFISDITKKKYTDNNKQIDGINAQIKQLEVQLSVGGVDLETEKLEALSLLKGQLATLKRSRGKNNAIMYRLNENSLSNDGISEVDRNTLLSFFPDTDIAKIEKINTFHSSICNILFAEISEQIKSTASLIEAINNTIAEVISQIESIATITSPSKIVVDKLLTMRKNAEKLSTENDAYDDLITYKEDKKSSVKLYDDIKRENTTILQQKLNAKMELINDSIYSETKKAPLITFSNNSYSFNTPDDTGTGTSYKNMIVFDLSVLELTPLPILIHDSIILKQVADEAIDKIMEFYTLFKNKQVFIAIDKKISYFESTSRILSETKVIELGKDGDELFGRSWNEKK